MKEPTTPQNRPMSQRWLIGAALLVIALTLAAFIIVQPGASSPPPDTIVAQSNTATPTATLTPTITRVPIVIATPAPPPTAALVTQDSAAISATSPATNPSAPHQPLSSPASPPPPTAITTIALLITAAPLLALATPPPTFTTTMVQGGVIALGGSDPGTWQGLADGSATYQLAEGADEGEALGQLAVPSVASISVELSSSGEDCGIAVGNPQNFTLVRLRPDGQHSFDVLLDQWQGDNYTTPPPQTVLRLNQSAAAWHHLSVTFVGGQLSYTVDGQSANITTSLPDNSSAYLYAGGSGCQYRKDLPDGHLGLVRDPVLRSPLAEA